VAIRTIRVEISFMTRGRPGRVGVNVHFRAISYRSIRIVSGVTMVATAARPIDRGGGPSRRGVGAGRRSAEAAPIQLPLEDAVFFDQVFDDVLLVAIDPSGEGSRAAPARGRHRPSLGTFPASARP
jgi:hypothetical protein